MRTMTRRRFIFAAAAGTAVTAFNAGNLRIARAVEKLKLGEHDALLVIDAQNCFAPGGSLAVSHGDEIVPVINKLAGSFKCVVMTQDWHPSSHVSFASAHGKKPFSTIDMPYGKQVMWPDHCIQGSQDANLLKDLDVTKANMILRKGFNPKVDGYSAFFDNDHKTSTGLEGYF